MSTKLHALADAKGRPIGFFMSAGQISDYTGAAALLANPVTRVHIGTTVYVVDDTTVGSSATATIVAGKCLDVTVSGVVVEVL